MASKQAAKLFDLQKKLANWSIRITKFFKHRILTKRKNGLIIGGDGSELRKILFQKLSKTWEISHINNILNVQNNPKVGQQSPLNESNKTPKTSASKKEDKKQFGFNGGNYSEIQSELSGKQFDAVIVLPDGESGKQYSFQDEEIATDFLAQYDAKIMKNFFAYRLANKYLTSSGVIILSCGEKDFLKSNDQASKKIENNDKKVQDGQLKELLIEKDRKISNYLLDGQVSYLGVVVGDRDYTDLNSWSVIALSEQITQTDVDYVSNFYRDWADGQRLPMPGSFALFKRKLDGKKCDYIEYL